MRLGLSVPSCLQHKYGTLRYLCFLAVFCNPKRGALICVDEPESGLHPDILISIGLKMERDPRYLFSIRSVRE